MSENVMRMHSNTAATHPNQLTNQLIGQLMASLQSWWLAFLDWRIQRAAILQLEALSDRELRDIGLRRGEIEGAVRCEPERQRAFGRHH
jgi:uncharacterized protein YjiS (DUF1127 family)